MTTTTTTADRGATTMDTRSTQRARRAVARLRVHWHHVARSGDTGGATVELVIATPVLMLLILLIVQAAVGMHATHVAQAAAGRALDATTAHGGSAAHGQKVGEQTLTALGGGVLKDPRVTVTRTATDADVDIQARAATVVPGITWPVRASATGRVERFVPPPESTTTSGP